MRCQLLVLDAVCYKFPQERRESLVNLYPNEIAICKSQSLHGPHSKIYFWYSYVAMISIKTDSANNSGYDVAKFNDKCTLYAYNCISNF